MNNSVLYPKDQIGIEPNPLRWDLQQKQIPVLWRRSGNNHHAPGSDHNDMTAELFRKGRSVSSVKTG